MATRESTEHWETEIILLDLYVTFWVSSKLFYVSWGDPFPLDRFLILGKVPCDRLSIILLVLILTINYGLSVPGRSHVLRKGLNLVQIF